MNVYLEPVLNFMILFIEACGAVIVSVGVMRAMIEYLKICFRRYNANAIAGLRIRLGQSMVIGLEFQVAADILKTGISPDWQDILVLAATIALRTILNYLLERELVTLAPGGKLHDHHQQWSEEDSM